MTTTANVMDTLSNVLRSRGTDSPRSTGSSPDASPAAQTRQGVSVRYAPAPNKQWFALRATYGREDLAAERLACHDVATYVAKRYTKTRIGNRIRLTLKSLIPNMVFAYTTLEQAKELVHHTPELDFVEFYYNRLDRNADGFNPPLVIPQHEMENFMLATRAHNEHVLLVSPGRCHFHSGDLVRVTEGVFCGVEGRVARVAGQQRVVLEVTGIGLVTTAYVPTAFLEPVV